jgi:hypothetical protein
MHLLMGGNSPIRAGFAAIKQNPSIAALEIAWRWVFGLVATILLLFGTKAFLAGLKLSEGDEQALHGNDPTIIAAALMHILQQAGVLQRFFGVLAAVAIPSAIIWVAAATLGRASTLRKLMPGSVVNAKAILGLNIARTALLFAAVLAWYIWMVLCALVTISPGEPSYALYLLLSVLALPVIAIVWGLLNWILSLGPVLASRAEDTAWSAYSETVQVVRRHRGQFTSVTTWLGLPRLAAMVVALIAAVVVLIATNSVLIGSVAIGIISLVYCAFADYLCIVRLAAYLQVLSAGHNSADNPALAVKIESGGG